MQRYMRSFIEFGALLALVILIRTVGFGLYQVPSPSMETTMLVGERFFADKLTPFFRSPTRGEIISFNDPYHKYSTNSAIRFIEEYFWGPANWTKRVIGLPGERVKGAIENGKPVVYVNDKKLDEPYINKYPLLAVRNEDKVDWVTYDLSKPSDQQQFHTIKPSNIIYGPTGGLQLLKPGMPLSHGVQINKHEGVNHWDGSDEFHVELGPNQYWLMGDNRLGSKDSRFWGPLDGNHIHGRILFRIWSVDSDAWLWPLDLLRHPIDFWNRVRWSRFFQWVS